MFVFLALKPRGWGIAVAKLLRKAITAREIFILLLWW